MLINYLNFFIAIFGIIVTGAAMLGPRLLIERFQYASNHMNIILGTNMVYLCAVALESYYMGRPGWFAHLCMNVTNFLQYALLYLMSAFVTFYLAYRIRESGRIKLNMGWYVYLYSIPFLLLLVDRFYEMYYYIGMDNMYYRGDWFILSQLLGLFSQLVMIRFFIEYRNYLSQMDQYLFLPMIILPSVAAFLQIFSKGLNIMSIAFTACCIFFSLLGIIFWNMRYIARKQELEQLKITMRFGKLWPDFIYNTLADISQLCKSDPMEASELIDRFADFLRKAMNDLSRVGCYPFQEEFAHLENYLALEEMRFGEDLEVFYDMEEMDFQIPNQVLQQTAQCMIRYVMSASENVYSLTVHTEKAEGGYLVEFYDENFGKDFLHHKQSRAELQDIRDIENRLRLINGSHMDYISTEAKGTMFKIYLPEA